jgi:hypothetical protein
MHVRLSRVRLRHTSGAAPSNCARMHGSPPERTGRCRMASSRAAVWPSCPAPPPAQGFAPPPTAGRVAAPAIACADAQTDTRPRVTTQPGTHGTARQTRGHASPRSKAHMEQPDRHMERQGHRQRVPHALAGTAAGQQANERTAVSVSVCLSGRCRLAAHRHGGLCRRRLDAGHGCPQRELKSATEDQTKRQASPHLARLEALQIHNHVLIVVRACRKRMAATRQRLHALCCRQGASDQVLAATRNRRTAPRKASTPTAARHTRVGRAQTLPTRPQHSVCCPRRAIPVVSTAVARVGEMPFFWGGGAPTTVLVCKQRGPLAAAGGHGMSDAHALPAHERVRVQQLKQLRVHDLVGGAKHHQLRVHDVPEQTHRQTSCVSTMYLNGPGTRPSAGPQVACNPTKNAMSCRVPALALALEGSPCAPPESDGRLNALSVRDARGTRVGSRRRHMHTCTVWRQASAAGGGGKPLQGQR